MQQLIVLSEAVKKLRWQELRECSRLQEQKSNK